VIGLTEMAIAEGDGHIEGTLRDDLASLDAELTRTQNAFTQVSGALDETAARLAHRESWRGWLRWPLGRVKRLFGGRSG